MTFATCFLWIFAGAPDVEAQRANKALAGALSAISAAVVGVILNLSIWSPCARCFVRARLSGEVACFSMLGDGAEDG